MRGRTAQTVNTRAVLSTPRCTGVPPEPRYVARLETPIEHLDATGRRRIASQAVTCPQDHRSPTPASLHLCDA